MRKSPNRSVKKVNTREFNKLLKSDFAGYVIYKKRKIMICKSIHKINDLNKRKRDLYFERRDRFLSQGLCSECGKRKISNKSVSRCNKCMEKVREYNKKRLSK